MNELYQQISDFHLPRHNEIPNVGLYLKQVVKYINDTLEPTFQIKVTETMLSNYVKMHLVSSPVKKQYDRDQIAILIFIVISKTVLSLDNLQTILDLQSELYERPVAYDYFCDEFERILHYVYGLSQISLEPAAEDPKASDLKKDIKKLVRNIIITVTHKFYLDHCFADTSCYTHPEA